MPLDFPSSATTGSIYTGTNGVLYTYDGVKWTGSTPQGSIIPSANLTYDLGSTSTQWRSLFVGTNTIYLGGTALSVSGGQLTVGGSPVIGGGFATTSTLVNGTATVQLIVGGGNNPYTLFPEYDSGQLYIQGGELATPNSGTVVISAGPDGGNIYLNTYGASPKQWAFNNGGVLNFPDGTTSTGANIYVPYATSSSFKITTVDDNMGMGPYQEKTFEVRGNTLYLPGANLIANGALWQLNSSGYLRFPTGGQIVYGDGLNTLNTGTLEIFAFDEDNHGQGTAVVINTNNEQEWRFESTGEFTLPGGGAIYNNPQTGQITIADALGPGGAPPMPSTAVYIDSTGTNVFKIIRGNGANNPAWYFNDNGNLTLPNSIIVKGINTNTIAIGNDQTGETNQSSFSIAIGGSAAQSTQSSVAIAIGFRAGRYSQGLASVAIGHQAGALYQGNSAIAFGNNAGSDTQGAQAVAVGSDAGNSNQGLQTVAIGNQAGAIAQGQRAVAIGSLAGGTNQGQYAVALGNFAGGNNQPANSIVINASGVQLDGSAAGLFIDPIRASTSTNTRNLLYYNSATKEITTSSNSALTFPDGTTSTGATIYVPYATSSTFRITTEVDMGPPPYMPLSFEVKGDTIKLPSGNGNIQSGSLTDIWSLDSTNKNFTFPNNSNIYYGDGTTLSTGTLQVRIDFGGEFGIFLSNPNKTWTFNNSGTIVFPDSTSQSTAWTKAAASVQSTPPASPVTGQLYYDTDDGRTYIYTGAAWIDSNPAGAGGGVTSLTAGTGTFVSTATGAITVWTGNTANLKETFETKNASTGTTVHDCTTNRLFYLTNLGTNFTPNFTNLSLSSGDATSVSLVVVQTSTARSITGVQIASTTSGVTLTWQGSATAPTGNASRTEVFTFSILCTATNAYTVLGMMTSFGGA